MREALKDYAVTDDNGEKMPVKDIEKLIKNLDEVIKETSKYLETLKIDLDKIIEKESTFDQLEELRNAYNKLVEKDATQDRFKVLSNTKLSNFVCYCSKCKTEKIINI
jgi:type I restriction enzyme R subunit